MSSLPMVGPLRIELRLPVYQTGVLPLNYGPLAGSRGIEPLKPFSPTVFETASSTNRTLPWIWLGVAELNRFLRFMRPAYYRLTHPRW